MKYGYRQNTGDNPDKSGAYAITSFNIAPRVYKHATTPVTMVFGVGRSGAIMYRAWLHSDDRPGILDRS